MANVVYVERPHLGEVCIDDLLDVVEDDVLETAVNEAGCGYDATLGTFPISQVAKVMLALADAIIDKYKKEI